MGRSLKQRKRDFAYTALNRLRDHSSKKEGSEDWRDPVWVIFNTSLDQIEHMLALVGAAIDSEVSSAILAHIKRKPGKYYLFTEWEREFYASVNDLYERRTLAGFFNAPLSGKQLVKLHAMYAKLALDVSYAFEIGEIK